MIGERVKNVDAGTDYCDRRSIGKFNRTYGIGNFISTMAQLWRQLRHVSDNA